MQFARQSGTDALFPEMDHHLVSSLLSGQGSPPCLIPTRNVYFLYGF